MTEREHALRTLWRKRIHLDPNALATSPRIVQGHFETPWQLVETYLHLIALLPAGLLDWWLVQPNGHIVINSVLSVYHPGVLLWHGQSFTGVTFITTQDLLDSGKGAFLFSMQLLDHLFGCGAEREQDNFSRGYGMTPDLEETAQRYVAIEKLQYGHAELNTTSPAAYLAETLWLGVCDHQVLNQIDPPLEKLYQQTLLNERFWRRQIKSTPGLSLPTNHTPELR
jgi:hypothetical protein